MKNQSKFAPAFIFSLACIAISHVASANCLPTPFEAARTATQTSSFPAPNHCVAINSTEVSSTTQSIQLSCVGETGSSVWKIEVSGSNGNCWTPVSVQLQN